MRPHRFLQLAVGAIALSIASFVVLGLGRLVVPVETARLLAAPLFFGGFLLAVVAFGLAMLVKVGVVGLDRPDRVS